MDKETARRLLPASNNHEFNEYLLELIKVEQESIYKTLPNIVEEPQLRMAQGKLQYLERLKTIRQRIQEAAK